MRSTPRRSSASRKKPQAKRRKSRRTDCCSRSSKHKKTGQRRFFYACKLLTALHCPGKTQLAPGFINHQCGGVGQVQAAALWLHGHPQPVLRWQGFPHINRQAPGFRAEHQVVTILEGHFVDRKSVGRERV